MSTSVGIRTMPKLHNYKSQQLILWHHNTYRGPIFQLVPYQVLAQFETSGTLTRCDSVRRNTLEMFNMLKMKIDYLSSDLPITVIKSDSGITSFQTIDSITNINLKFTQKNTYFCEYRIDKSRYHIFIHFFCYLFL